jgi:hypothetical protein
MADRFFTEQELTALSRTPRQELVDCLEGGGAVGPLVASIARSYRDQIGGSRSWVGSIFAHICERHGQEGLARAVAATSRFFVALAAVGGSPPDAEGMTDDFDGAVDRVAERAQAGDRDAALALYDAFETAGRVVQDTYCDWLSSLLSEVYRSWGPDELEDLHRYCAQRTLLPWMTVDIHNAPEKRLVRWVRMLKGHFSVLRVREDDEKFVLVQDPCGTCSRQILAGRYHPPFNLAVVEEEHVLTWGRGSTPVYRTHVPVWHVAMARERLGVPWPVNRCPAGLGAGPCETFLYKDPLDPRANDQVPS